MELVSSDCVVPHNGHKCNRWMFCCWVLNLKVKHMNTKREKKNRPCLNDTPTQIESHCTSQLQHQCVGRVKWTNKQIDRLKGVSICWMAVSMHCNAKPIDFNTTIVKWRKIYSWPVSSAVKQIQANLWNSNNKSSIVSVSGWNAHMTINFEALARFFPSKSKLNALKIYDDVSMCECVCAHEP